MKPIKFMGSNTTYTAEGCGGLPALVANDAEGQPRIISCWRMNWQQRLKVLLTGRIWLDIWGTIQPPVALEVDRPFKQDDMS